ncbi:5-methylthioadenosine/S-adenosylhomocysteine deaminase [Arboricoccus pini]|uniref:5-methylthioadenosine/S-adenosylhomocysteine deaminase n=1 Tax=Arboricoccus pini TaxID=1963835 RepID=A0A212RG07_9PROT|nr:amidohydrolase [Arboricoccus pini]SNB71262.1 5-methylthioadenosine/S-adenosylhomocysteine deaminase [Arboricoccus pini]
MPTFIRGATILAMGGRHQSTPFTGDILIVGDRIEAIGANLPVPEGATLIEGAGKLVMPGLINAHLHSGEALFKGRYDNLPLELWMLYSYPILGAKALAERMIYLRSMVVAIESLKTGVTSLTDDIFEAPRQSFSQLGAAVQAYDDAGIRATVSGHVMDRDFLDSIPFSREYVPTDLQAEVAKLTPPTTEEYLDFAREAYAAFHGRSGRIRFMLAPSAPQRCTVELMQAVNELALEWKVPFHTHIVETKVQGVTGPALYGKTLMRYMADLGLMHPGTTIAHSVWVTPDDIALMGEAGVSIVHNIISNQKLGSGIAPVRDLLDAGVNVALGSDGICSNDTPRMFDVMHACGLIHKVTTPDYKKWLSAAEVLHACTLAGARSALIDREVGSLEVGKKADLLVLDLNTVSFTPRNDILNHLVYCENGSSIEKVMVNGEIVVENGRLTKIDEAALLAELQAAMPSFNAYHAGVERANKAFEPHFDAVYRRCNQTDLGIHRLIGASDIWPAKAS